jgi:hypothetical protein
MVFMKTPSFLLIGSLLSVLSIAREAAAVELVGDWKQCTFGIYNSFNKALIKFVFFKVEGMATQDLRPAQGMNFLHQCVYTSAMII